MIYNIGAFAVATMLITELLSVLQKFFYRSSILFFFPNPYAEEINYFSMLVFQHPLAAAKLISKHFFLVNFVAPLPHVFAMQGMVNPAVTFSAPTAFTLIGLVAAALWVFLLLTGVLKSIFSYQNSAFFIGAALCLLFNMALHSIYGINEDLFLYTGDFTFLVLAFAAAHTLSRNYYTTAFLAVFLIFLASNNLTIIGGILKLYS